MYYIYYINVLPLLSFARTLQRTSLWPSPSPAYTLAPWGKRQGTVCVLDPRSLTNGHKTYLFLWPTTLDQGVCGSPLVFLVDLPDYFINHQLLLQELLVSLLLLLLLWVGKARGVGGSTPAHCSMCIVHCVLTN